MSTLSSNTLLEDERSPHQGSLGGQEGELQRQEGERQGIGCRCHSPCSLLGEIVGDSYYEREPQGHRIAFKVRQCGGQVGDWTRCSSPMWSGDAHFTPYHSSNVYHE